MHITFAEDTKMKERNTVICLYHSATKSQTLRFFRQISWGHRIQPPQRDEEDALQRTAHPDRAAVAFSLTPAQGWPVTVLGRGGMGHREVLVPKYATECRE